MHYQNDPGFKNWFTWNVNYWQRGALEMTFTGIEVRLNIIYRNVGLLAKKIEQFKGVWNN